ncbi:hypothetical protein RQP46_007037 [Phenoliferia psychrophenolica]
MAEQLREISERLRSIESSLENVRLGSGSAADASPTSLPSLTHHHSSEADSSSSASINNNDAGHLSGANGSNPLNTVNEFQDAIEASSPKGVASPTDWLGAGGTNMSPVMSRLFAGAPIADAVIRGVMTAEECEASFQIFFLKLAPWTMFFDDKRDRSASAMRERSPLLFHAILLSTGYYLSTSERGAQVYYALTALVNELIAPLLISALPQQVNTDFVRALCLLVLYKPVQHAALFQAGITDPEQQEASAKVNASSGSILSGVMIRTAFALSLPSITSTFAKSFSPTIAIAPQVVSDLRLWLWLCIVDTHGALTTGRSGQVDIQEALKTTRLFSSLKLQPFDVRLAATVELYATARLAVSSAWFAGARSIAPHELRKFNKDLDEWEAFWKEPLRDAAAAGDAQAYTVSTVFMNFIRLVVNSSVFTRWRTERNLRPTLTTEDWSFLTHTVNAAERVAFSLCIESRSDGIFTREVNWPAKQPGQPRPPLQLDPVVVDSHRTAFDTITTVVYVYSLILLAKMANTGLIRCELRVLSDEYERGVSLDMPKSIVDGAKLGRLLELGSSFLETIAPTPSHPARKHARMLKAIFAAGTQGQVLLRSDVLASTDSTPASASSNPQPTAATSNGGAGTADAEQPDFALSSSELGTFTGFPPTPQDNGDSGAGASTAEPGLALASVLGGISPSFFGDLGFFDGMWTGTDANGMDGMAIDWDNLATNMAKTPAVEFMPPVNPSDYFVAR